MPLWDAFSERVNAPTSVVASPANAQASVSWVAPASTNGSVISGYVVTPYVGGVAQTARTFTSTATAEVVTGLTNGTSYTFVVAARNANGLGVQSAATAAVIAGAPLAPTSVVAMPGNGRAVLNWTAPTSANGSPITSYVLGHAKPFN